MRIIREKYTECASHYTTDRLLIESLWQEIERRYSAGGRHYHTLSHLENLVRELIPFKSHFLHWDTVVFAVVYHDIIYKTLKNNNEKKSALFAEKELQKISVPRRLIHRCQHFILATKKHESSDDETDLFTDADLYILGSDPDTYLSYTRQIRKEFAIYPGIVYYAGRKKVLQHFLAMERIYKTASFYARYEVKARTNIANELKDMT